MSAKQAEEPPKKVPRIEQQETPQIIEKVDRNNEDISVPNWLIEMLTWIERIEMANSGLTTSSWVFEQLCEPKLHGQVEPHAVGHLELVAKKKKDAVSGNLRGIARYGGKFVPIPSTPPPDYITGFKYISIIYLDARILDFLKCIAPKLNDVQLFDMGIGAMNGWGTKEEDKRTAMVDSLLNILANKIEHFEIDNNFGKFNALFPGFIDQINSIFVDLNGGFDVGFLYKWLTDRKSNEQSKQKILELLHNEEFLRGFFVRVEQEFANATNPVNFQISFYGENFDFDIGEFTRENEKTSEVLVAYQKQFDEENIPLLLRCPKGEEERWKAEGEKKLMVNRSKDATKLHVNIKKFGAFNDMA